MSPKLILFGTGDIARLAHVYFKTDSTYDVVAFTVDRKYCETKTFGDLPLVPFDEVEKRYPPKEHEMFIAVSYAQMNKLRAEKYAQAKTLGYRLASYVSSKCSFLTENPVGDNCFILEDNTVQPFVRIGNNVTLWSGNHIGHHSEIKDHNFISSHVVISGHCEINEYCFIGVNSTLHNNVVIGKENLIAAGAIIAKSTEE